MEVFPQLGQNLIHFKAEHNKLPEKIPRHCTVRAGDWTCWAKDSWTSNTMHLLTGRQGKDGKSLGNLTAILMENIISLPVPRYSCGALETSAPQGSAQDLHSSPSCLPKWLLQVQHILQMLRTWERSSCQGKGREQETRRALISPKTVSSPSVEGMVAVYCASQMLS